MGGGCGGPIYDMIEVRPITCSVSPNGSRGSPIAAVTVNTRMGWVRPEMVIGAPKKDRRSLVV